MYTAGTSRTAAAYPAVDMDTTLKGSISLATARQGPRASATPPLIRFLNQRALNRTWWDLQTFACSLLCLPFCNHRTSNVFTLITRRRVTVIFLCIHSLILLLLGYRRTNAFCCPSHPLAPGSPKKVPRLMLTKLGSANRKQLGAAPPSARFGGVGPEKAEQRKI